MTSRNPDSDPIRSLLRRVDPARGESLAPEAAARIRLRLDAEAARREGLLPAARRLAWAAMAAVMIAAVVIRFSASPPSPPGEPAAHAPAPVVAAASAEARQVQFVTHGGTRIVWVLSSNLNL